MRILSITRVSFLKVDFFCSAPTTLVFYRLCRAGWLKQVRVGISAGTQASLTEMFHVFPLVSPRKFRKSTYY